MGDGEGAGKECGLGEEGHMAVQKVKGNSSKGVSEEQHQSCTRLSRRGTCGGLFSQDLQEQEAPGQENKAEPAHSPFNLDRGR